MAGDELAQQLLHEVAEMRAELRALRSERAGPARAPAPITVLAIYELYKAARQHEETWKLVYQQLRYFVERLGGILAADVTSATWDAHRAVRATTPTQYGKPPCPAVRNAELRAARAMFKWAVKGRMLASNPLDGAEVEPAISARETWLTVEQFARLLEGVEALKHPHQRALLYVYLYCSALSGMRIGEVLRLRRDRIGLHGELTLEAKRTKSRRQRTINLTRRALAAINDVPVVVGVQYVFANIDRKDKAGEPYDDATVRRWFRDAAIAAGLDPEVAEGDVKLVPHDMRHTFASQADERGARATDIQDTLGHRELRTTERYLHREKKGRARAMAALMDGPVGESLIHEK